MSKDTPDRDPAKKNHSEGTVSEAGSSALNEETTLGGADNVPDTPDVNEADSDIKDPAVAKDDQR